MMLHHSLSLVFFLFAASCVGKCAFEGCTQGSSGGPAEEFYCDATNDTLCVEVLEPTHNNLCKVGTRVCSTTTSVCVKDRVETQNGQEAGFRCVAKQRLCNPDKLEGDKLVCIVGQMCSGIIRSSSCVTDTTKSLAEIAVSTSYTIGAGGGGWDYTTVHQNNYDTGISVLVFCIVLFLLFVFLYSTASPSIRRALKY